jgi:NADPH:quinone reductase-like Zn-dependent oxidoreductase
MRAVQITRFGGPEVMDVVDLPDPTPADGEVLDEVSSSGVNFADTHHRRGAHPLRAERLLRRRVIRRQDAPG